MENKINIQLAEGQSELTIREGEAAPQLAPKAPIKTEISGTIGAPLEWLTKRIGTEQWQQKDCHIAVNREAIEITLVMNESDPYRRGTVTGELEHHPKFVEFGINQPKQWTPADLGLFMKMNRAYFPDKQANMALVSQLLNFKARVNQQIERGVSENGSRTDNFSQVVYSNLPKAFTLEMPLFKGMAPESIEVETFAQIDGREVRFVLLSPGAQATLEEIRDRVIDEQLEEIREIAPAIAIIEM